MKLFYYPGACSLAPHIVLREAGFAFDLDKVDMKAKTTADGSDYLAVNPKGAVPALDLGGGEVLTEGPAITQYLADQKPESGLAPKPGTLERARLQEMLNYLSSEVHKAFGAAGGRRQGSEAGEEGGDRNRLQALRLSGDAVRRRARIRLRRDFQRRRRLSLRAAELGRLRRHRPQDLAEARGLSGPHRRAAQGARSPGRRRPRQGGLTRKRK